MVIRVVARLLATRRVPARWTGPGQRHSEGTAHHAKRSKVRVSLSAPFRAAPVYALCHAVFALRMLSLASPRASCRRSVPSTTSVWCIRVGRKSFCRCSRAGTSVALINSACRRTLMPWAV